MIVDTKTVTCDLCGKKIEESPFGGYFGRAYVIYGMFGCKAKADTCDECSDIIRNKRIEQEEKGGAE